VQNKTGPNAGKVTWRGFPGPAAHYLMYQRLKERALEALRRSLVGPRGRSGQIVYLAGMRWSESQRRFRNAEEIEPAGAIVWCSPIVHWTNGHIAEYRERHRCRISHDHADHLLCEPGSLPLNEVTVHLHMSGDCLCGAFAEEGEIHGLELFYPDVAAELHDIEGEARACGIPEPRCTWGWGAGRERAGKAGRLCSTCAVPQLTGQQELFPAAEEAVA
jgi:3'-phosphoadenosine 5'-phosphosulfate sulfotransferase (PAPS reductase)/FAD synthetase